MIYSLPPLPINGCTGFYHTGVTKTAFRHQKAPLLRHFRVLQMKNRSMWMILFYPVFAVILLGASIGVCIWLE
jgi:hypothetical protein